MYKKLTQALTWALAVVPVLAVLLCYKALPAQVPMHWGLGGEVGYGGKESLWLTALLPLLLVVLFRALPRVDPRRKNYAKFQNYYDGFCLVMTLFLLAMNALVLSESFWPGRISVGRVVPIGVGLLFVTIGNIMPKIKSNFFMGVKTPWTLSDPDVWNRTNRLGGQCFFILGLLMIPSSLLLPETANFVVLMVGAAAVALVPTVMSYRWYRQKNANKLDNGSQE